MPFAPRNLIPKLLLKPARDWWASLYDPFPEDLPERKLRRCWARVGVLFLALGMEVGSIWAETGAGERGQLTVVSIHEDLLPGIRAVLPEFAAKTGWSAEAQAVPYSAHELWIRTQILSRSAPDVLLVESTDLPWRYGHSGLLVRWDAWLSQPNHYDGAHASRPWIDTFQNELIHQTRDAAGAIWCVPYTQYGVGFFYNRAVYDELGLSPPRTWEELLANFAAVRASGRSALVTAVKPNDHQSLWMADMILELQLRPVAEQVNVQTRAGWKFDALDPECTRGEVITLEERLVAFDRGLIDPARAPAFRETARLIRRLAAEFRPDFLSLDGEEVPRVFARGQSVHFLNGTWYLRPLTAMQRGIAEIAPERVFPWAVFPFPELTAQSTPLPRLGGINQNSGLRACFIVPRRPDDPDRERRAIDLVRFLTAPAVAAESFGRTAVYDLPAMPEVAPKPGAEPLVPKVRYAFLTLAQFRGYDARSEGEFWNLWQGLLGGLIDEDEFVRRLGASHRAALFRLSQEKAAQMDRTFLRQQLPEGFRP